MKQITIQFDYDDRAVSQTYLENALKAAIRSAIRGIHGNPVLDRAIESMRIIEPHAYVAQPSEFVGIVRTPEGDIEVRQPATSEPQPHPAGFEPQQPSVLLPMTTGQYMGYVGAPPEDDDLERVNCPLAGQVGHQGCGWNKRANLPAFMSFITDENDRLKVQHDGTRRVRDR
jgi:hypothetical protein